MTLILNTTLKATRPSKKLAQTAAKTEEGVSQAAKEAQAAQAAKAVIKTVLVASYGWPTDAMLPSTKQSSKR